MAAGKKAWQRDVFQVNHHKPNGFARPRRPFAAEGTMKQVDIVNKEELDKERFQVHYIVHGPGKAKRLSSCKRKGCRLEEGGSKLRRSTSDVGRVRDPGMANKENELSCSGAAAWALYSNDSSGLLLNSAQASKMAGAGSKGSDITELSKDHEAMTHILFGRNLRLNVARTLWRRNASELVAYLIRIQDMGVLLDCLPVLTKDLQTEASCLSLGCCNDLTPQVKAILASQHEEHILVGLRWLQAVIRKWWLELSQNEKELQGGCSEHSNVKVVKQRLKDLWKEGTRLCLIPGSTGELAKLIEAYLSQLP